MPSSPPLLQADVEDDAAPGGRVADKKIQEPRQPWEDDSVDHWKQHSQRKASHSAAMLWPRDGGRIKEPLGTMRLVGGFDETQREAMAGRALRVATTRVLVPHY